MPKLRSKYRKKDIGIQLLSLAVLVNGIIIIAQTLALQLIDRHSLFKISSFSIDARLLIGLSFIYLSSLLSRHKRTAFIATALIYTFYLGINLETASDVFSSHHLHFFLLRGLVFPVIVLSLLLVNSKKFVVKSDPQGFKQSLIFSFIILMVTFIYGTLGFVILDDKGFHQHFTFPTAMHYTIDQIGITTSKPLVAYTKSADIFLASLSFISVAAVIYVFLSLFKPLRSRLIEQSTDRDNFKELILKQADANSEDFFKIWPHDKQYFFDSTGASGFAYHVNGGVALILGGPTGKQARFRQLFREFQYVCYGNDWRTAIVHTEEKYVPLYKELGFTVQLLGQEAVVDVEKFNTTTVRDKYYRNINNKFTKGGYTFETLVPPHHDAVYQRLKVISDEWLSAGGRDERAFTMGYFTKEYINMCEIMVVKDAAGTIQAFTNLIPEEFDNVEATYDMLRYSKNALGNINDFLLCSVIKELSVRGYQRLNLGLSPLVGINDKNDQKKTLVDNILRFAYENGDRFYSFSGLHRFKSKYDPTWRPRYICYQGGISGFSRSTNALLKTMKKSVRKEH